MRYLLLAALAFFTLSDLAIAQSLVEPDYDGEPHTTNWVTYYTPENYKADKNFIVGMTPHHVGALTMSEDYLAQEGAQSQRLQALAKGIIRNQTFEVGMLQDIERHIDAIDLSEGGSWETVAKQGLANEQQFYRAAPPAIQSLFNGDDIASATDVQFAKAMIVHHEGALMMCEDYLDNPNINNGYLERMCIDVLRDQAQEIQLMWNIVATYPANHCDIKITPDMIDGMDDMMSHMDFSKVNCTAKKMKCACKDGGHKHKNKMDHKCKCCGDKKMGDAPCPMNFDDHAAHKKHDMKKAHSGHHDH